MSTTGTSGAMGADGTERTYWRAEDLGIENRPLLFSLIEYRQKKNRHQTVPWSSREQPNLISSLTTDGRHMPIIDLDFDFHIEPSSTDGHVHLYFDKPISKTKFRVLMLALWYTGVVEMGYAVWALRRGANFVRLPHVKKKPGAETDKPEYGWLFKLKDKK